MNKTTGNYACISIEKYNGHIYKFHKDHYTN